MFTLERLNNLETNLCFKHCFLFALYGILPAAQVPMARWSHAPTWSSLTCFIKGRGRCKGRMEVVAPQLRARQLIWLLSLTVHLPGGGNFLLPNFIRKKLRSSGAVFHTLNTMPQKQQLREREVE